MNDGVAVVKKGESAGWVIGGLYRWWKGDGVDRISWVDGSDRSSLKMLHSILAGTPIGLRRQWHQMGGVMGCMPLRWQ